MGTDSTQSAQPWITYDNQKGDNLKTDAFALKIYRRIYFPGKVQIRAQRKTHKTN